MKKTAVIVLAILLILTDIQIAAAFTADRKALIDSKSEKLSAVDAVFLKYDKIVLNRLTTAKVLVNRVTNKVEYVFLNNEKRYVRPRFVMPDAQALYERTRAKK